MYFEIKLVEISTVDCILRIEVAISPVAVSVKFIYPADNPSLLWR